MKKLTAEKCRSVIQGFKWMAAEGPGMSIRDEYDIQAYELALKDLEQQEQGDGWIEWGGGKRPVISGKQVEVKFRGGEGCIALSGELDWRDTESCGDIIAYRIIPEQPTNQNGEK